MNAKRTRRSLSLLAMMLLFKALIWTTTPQAAQQTELANVERVEVLNRSD